MAKNVPGTFLAARGSNGRWLLLLLAPLLGIALTGALVPPGLLWGDEPNGYDVVEYHLQVPREWCEAGRITPLQHNAFSYFPFNVEMQYLLAMEIQGGPWKGMYLAQLMHVAMVALGIGAVYGLVKELGGSDLNASVGAVIAGSVPWMSWLAPVAYNEGGLILFGTLGVGWVLVAMREDAKSRAAVFAGVFAGLACGVKLTAVPVVVIATPIALLAARWSGRNLRRAILFVAFACVVFSPWLIRNIAWTGNPAFPEGMSIFGRGHFSEDQVERWSRAHSPTEQQRSIGARVTAFVDQIVTDSSYAWLLLPMAIAAAVLAWRRAECRTLAILIGLHALFWIAFTHLQGRFFVLLVPWGAILIALSLANLPSIRISAVGLSVAMAVIGLSVVITKVTAVQVRFNFFGQSDLSALTPLADEKPGPGTQVVLIGDAQAFFYQMPMKQLHYRTVFDVNARPDESVIDAWRAGAPSGPNTIDVINPSELLRFSRTYWKIPAPSPEIAAHERPFVVRH
ncbi:MAG TPA: glycosyltransferase family 39 protein, partial [Tepidisphaeraceae bacterium]|nr:glycosyltransferase family 39 protein [Tepidisphaeraceae bacterium]